MNNTHNPEQNFFLADKCGDILSAEFRQMVLEVTEQMVDEVTRIVEEKTKERISAMEERKQKLEDAVQAMEERMEQRLRETESSMTERLQSLEEQMQLLEECVPPRPQPGRQVTAKQLEKRMEALEESLQKALCTMMPQVDALADQIEEDAPLPEVPAAVAPPPAGPRLPTPAKRLRLEEDVEDDLQDGDDE